MAHEVESAYYAGNRKAWHGVGKVFKEDGLATPQAVVEAGLDWTVSLVPVEHKGVVVTDDLSDSERARWNMTVRSTDDRVLGLVGPQYKAIQNLEMFEFGDALVSGGEAHWDSAGSLKGGRWVFANLKVNEDLIVMGDTIEQYLTFMSSHDGSAAFTILPVNYRVECANMFRYRMAQAKNAGSVYSVRHSQSADARIAEARKALGITFAAGKELAAEAERLAMVKVSDAEFGKMLNAVLPMPVEPKDADETALKKHERQVVKVDQRQQLYVQMWNESPNLENIRGTAWGAVNAIVEADDHHVELGNRGATPKRERRMLGILDGHRTSQRAFDYFAPATGDKQAITV